MFQKEAANQRDMSLPNVNHDASNSYSSISVDANKKGICR